MRCKFLSLLLVFYAALAAAAPAQEQVARPLAVAVAAEPPYAQSSADGRWHGPAIDLWRQLADDLGISFDFVAAEEGDPLGGLSAGRYDVLLPVLATPQSLAAAALTPPFHTAPLGVVQRQSFLALEVAKAFVSWRFVRIVLGLSVLLLVVGTLIYWTERRRNEQFAGDGSHIRGLGSGFWWAAVTMTTIGYGDKTPQSFSGRTVAVLWMLVAMVLTAGLTATLVSLTGIKGEARAARTLDDLPQGTYGVTAGSIAETYLKATGRDIRPFATRAEGLGAVADREIEGFVGLAPRLRADLAAQSLPTLAMADLKAQLGSMVIALPKESPLIEPLGEAVIARSMQPEWWRRVERQMPKP